MSRITPDPYPSRVGAPPELVERVDPVVSGNASSPLRLDQVEAYERDGYVVVPELFSAEEVRRLDLAVEECIADAAMGDTDRLVVEPDSEEIRSVFSFHGRTDLGDVARDPRLVEVAHQLLGSEVYIHQSRVNCKPGYRGKRFQWHSDFETWHTEDGMPRIRSLSAVVWLTDNHTWNGPLIVMPGSHRWFATCKQPTPPENHHRSLRAQEVGVPTETQLDELYERCGIRPCIGPAGSVLFFDANLMHGSAGNISPEPRRNLFLVYNSVDNALVEPFAAPARRPEVIASRDFTPVAAASAVRGRA